MGAYLAYSEGNWMVGGRVLESVEASQAIRIEFGPLSKKVVRIPEKESGGRGLGSGDASQPIRIHFGQSSLGPSQEENS